jgi:hypothetical protein
MSGPHWRKLGLAQRHLSQKNDKLLFVACTTITIGNEHKTTFWTSSLASWATSQRLSPASVPEDETQKEIASKGSTWQQVDSRSQHPRGLHNGALAASCKSVDSRITDVAASGAGGRHIMEPNTQRQPTRPSLLAALKHQSSLLSGKCGHHQSASFSHGSSFRIEFGLWIGWWVEIGITTQLVPYVEQWWKRHITLSHPAATQDECELWWRIELVIGTSTRTSGQTSQWFSGGQTSLLQETFPGKLRVPWRCWFSGRSG